MASVVFAGSTIWDSNSTGRGRVACRRKPATTRWVEEIIPGNGEIVAKNNGTSPAIIQASGFFWFTEAQAASKQTQLESLRAANGTLNTPEGMSYNNCIMKNSELVRTSEQCRDGSTQLYVYTFNAIFKQLKV